MNLSAWAKRRLAPLGLGYRLPRALMRLMHLKAGRRAATGRVRAPRTAALIFSRFFWEDESLWPVGSGRMQREAYEGLRAAGYTTTFAGQEDRMYSRGVLDANLIVSLAPGLAKLPGSVRGIKLLYTCNTHVLERVSRQRATALKWHLPLDEDLAPKVHLAAYAAADYFLIAENEAGIRNFERHGIPPDRIYRYNNCVDTDVWAPAAQKRPIFTFVCWASSLGLRKGLPSLVKAWETWFSGQDAQLILVGEGSRTSDRLFDGRRGGLGRPGLALHLGGFRPHDPDAVELVRTAHAAVYPTLDDAQPTAVQEMVACGLPVITTVEAGFDFPAEFCTYVTADDPASIARAFDEWFARRNCLAPFGAKARAFMLEHHQWRHFRQRFAAILEDVEAHRRGGGGV